MHTHSGAEISHFGAPHRRFHHDMEKRMKSLLFAGACALAVAYPAVAEPWVDWTPQKGVTSVTVVKVDPNHIDDYLTGLK